MRIVIDTSALLGVLLNQGPKEEIVDKTQGATLIAPQSLHWEVGNALSSLLKRKKLTLPEALEVIEEYSRVPLQFAEIDLKAALEISGRNSIYAYDAYMIECAQRYKLPLLSLDKGLLEAAKREKVRILEV